MVFVRNLVHLGSAFENHDDQHEDHVLTFFDILIISFKATLCSLTIMLKISSLFCVSILESNYGSNKVL